MKTKIEGLVLCCIKVVSNIVTLGLRSKGNIHVSICTSNKSRHNEQLKEHGNWIEQKITYILSVGLSLFPIVPVKEKDYIYEKWHIWKIESEPYFTVVYYWFAISIDNLYASINKEHPLTFFFWHYVREEEKLENTKGVIRSCKSERYIQDKDQKKKNKRTINDQQNITQRTKDLIKTRSWTQVPRNGEQFLFLHVTLVTNLVKSYDRIVITTSETYLWSFVK